MDADEARKRLGKEVWATVAAELTSGTDIRDVLDVAVATVMENPSLLAAFNLPRDVVLEALGGEFSHEDSLGPYWQFPTEDGA